MADRRTFLRACIAGTGMILVPKYADAFRWKPTSYGYNEWSKGLMDMIQTSLVHTLSGSTYPWEPARPIVSELDDCAWSDEGWVKMIQPDLTSIVLRTPAALVY